MTSEITVRIEESRHFSGVVGLTPDFGAIGKSLDAGLARSVLQAWAQERKDQHMPYIREVVISPAQQGLYLIPIGNKLRLSEKKVAPILGEITDQEKKLSDEEVLEALVSFFTALGKAFCQRSIRFTYWGFGGNSKSLEINIPFSKL